jgi:hypothetical protein
MCPELDWASADWTSDDFGTGGELCVPIARDFDAEWAQLFERHASDGVKVLSGIRFGRIGVTTGATRFGPVSPQGGRRRGRAPGSGISVPDPQRPRD